MGERLRLLLRMELEKLEAAVCQCSEPLENNLATTNMTALLFSALTAEFLPPGPCSRREASWNRVFPGERPATGYGSLQVSRVKFWERAACQSPSVDTCTELRMTATLQKQDLGPAKTTSWYLELRTNRRNVSRIAHSACNKSGTLLRDAFIFSHSHYKHTQPFSQTFSLSIVSFMPDLNQPWICSNE